MPKGEKHKLRRAIILDRDGVINKVVIRNGRPFSPRRLKEFKLFPNIQKYLESFRKMGFLNIVFTNQPDISRGLLKRKELRKMHKIILETLPIDEIKFCPHDDNDNCSCRKPKPGLILEAAKNWSIDLKKSYVVGDGWKDMAAGKKAGCKTFLIRKEYNKNLQNGFDFRVNNLKEVIKIIRKLL